MNHQESISIMTDAIVSILADQQPTVYLYGSAASNDFRLGWSDLDILVLTQTEIAQEQSDVLVHLRQTMLDRFPGNPYFRSFEGTMLRLTDFLGLSTGRVVYWGTNGQRITDQHYFDSFSLSELLDHGRLLHGDDLREHMVRPSYAQLREDVAQHYQAIRQHAQSTGRSIFSYGWLLDVARGIYTLRTGKIIAKTHAGEWALDAGICPVPDALRKAVAIRKTPQVYLEQGELLDHAERVGADIQQFADVLEMEFANTLSH